MDRRTFLHNGMMTTTGALGFTLGGCTLDSRRALVAPQKSLVDRFFIMDTWFWANGLETAQQAEALKRIGWPKTTESRSKWETFPETLRILDGADVELCGIYVPIKIDSGDLPDAVADAIRLLKGRDTLVWFNLNSDIYERSDLSGDRHAIRLLRQASELARVAGVEISIYPHVGSWAERVEDGFRVARKTGCENVGCTFNLYHWLKAEGPENLETKARAALPKLNCVTLNGSMKNAMELKVEEGILPLGDGDYDVETFVKTFVRMGYDGPFGLQGYGIGGNIDAKLKQSLTEWRSYCAELGR